MEFGGYLEQIALQAAGLRSAAVAAGPDAPVPTCPGWTVHTLVRHVAKVHNWAGHALHADPGGAEVPPAGWPEAWHDLLSWWDEQVDILLERLLAGGPEAPAWVFDAEDAPRMGFWARRQAHETAIHRLDAEHAMARSGLPTAVPLSIFDADLAADGIDEVLMLWVPRTPVPERPAGTVSFHATDVDRRWLVRLERGAAPVTRPAERADATMDATVAGTADAVYRAAWRRPSTAATAGARPLVDALLVP